MCIRDRCSDLKSQSIVRYTQLQTSYRSRLLIGWLSCTQHSDPWRPEQDQLPDEAIPTLLSATYELDQTVIVGDESHPYWVVGIPPTVSVQEEVDVYSSAFQLHFIVQSRPTIQITGANVPNRRWKVSKESATHSITSNLRYNIGNLCIICLLYTSRCV